MDGADEQKHGGSREADDDEDWSPPRHARIHGTGDKREADVGAHCVALDRHEHRARAGSCHGRPAPPESHEGQSAQVGSVEAREPVSGLEGASRHARRREQSSHRRIGLGIRRRGREEHGEYEIAADAVHHRHAGAEQADRQERAEKNPVDSGESSQRRRPTTARPGGASRAVRSRATSPPSRARPSARPR